MPASWDASIILRLIKMLFTETPEGLRPFFFGDGPGSWWTTSRKFGFAQYEISSEKRLSAFLLGPGEIDYSHNTSEAVPRGLPSPMKASRGVPRAKLMVIPIDQCCEI